MTTETKDDMVARVEQQIRARQIDLLRLGYVGAPDFVARLRSANPDLQDVIPAALARLEDTGQIETERNIDGTVAEYRLTSRAIVETILAEGLVIVWRIELGTVRYYQLVDRVRALMHQHPTTALETSPRGAFRAAFACVNPRLGTADASRYGQRAYELTTLGGSGGRRGAVDPVALLKAMTSMRDFPGSPEELLETSLAVIGAAPS